LGTERKIIDFEESLLETRWGAKKYESHERLHDRELRGDSVGKRLFPKKIVRGNH